MQALIDELYNLLQAGIRIPISGKVLVDEAAFSRIIEEMRSAAPAELRAGQQIASERDRILAEARAQARRIVEEAQAQLNQQLDQQAVVQAGRQRARDIQNEAERSAARLKQETDEYILGQFGAFESRLIRILREVQAGQRALSPEGERAESGAHS